MMSQLREKGRRTARPTGLSPAKTNAALALLKPVAQGHPKVTPPPRDVLEGGGGPGGWGV